ncbi:VOC family protein [Dermacoccus barathri]
MASRLSPYLQFRDTARQALEFYHGVLGGDLTLSTFGDMGVEGQEAHKIMHGMLTTTDEFVLMGSDTPEQMEYTPAATSRSASPATTPSRCDATSPASPKVAT